ncbi:hypothetical protein ACLB2K_015828 [Fragaria x ananassa]
MSRATDTMIRGMDSESIKKYLFKIAMKSDWEGIVQAYSQNPQAHKAIITKSGETALHIAVLDGQEELVEKLVNLVSLEELKLQNLRGNTPLHFAAAQGNVRMCMYMCIAKDRSLVDILNKDKETPLFLAALHGKKDAFLCLHYIRTPNKPDPEYYSYCRREDGDTILHCAISGEYFGILVDELNVEKADHFNERVTNTILNKENAPKCPELYETCINFLLVFWKMARVFVTHKEGCCRKCQKESRDLENQETNEGNSGPCDTCFNFVKLLSKAMLIVLGLGSTEIQKIRNKKEKHKWAVQIMDNLLESAGMYEYEDSGMKPLAAPISSHKDGGRPYRISDGGDCITTIEETSAMIFQPTDQQDENTYTSLI